VNCLWLGLGLLLGLPLLVVLTLVLLYYWLCWKYMDRIVRVFQEKPLFIIPRGQKVPEAEEIQVPTPDGLLLSGCYLHGQGSRRGVILFGLEFGSNRWACIPYCQHLLESGYDICAVDPRGQGDSPKQPGYDPLHWVTEYEIQDMQAAIAYLRARPDADPRGIGFFGISKGGGAGIFAGCDDPYVRCFVTDGIFATYSTLVPYMRKWFSIYNTRVYLHDLLPLWYYGLVGMAGLHRIEAARHCRFPHLETALARRGPAPLLMIHGSGDTYIKPAMGRNLFDRAAGPKEFWLVEGAKHNQSLQVAGEEYHRRVRAFFDQHLAALGSPREERTPALDGSHPAPSGSTSELAACPSRGEQPCSAPF
jgi:pimeloyl-ACP methyl ester carboxylesterase